MIWPRPAALLVAAMAAAGVSGCDSAPATKAQPPQDRSSRVATTASPTAAAPSVSPYSAGGWRVTVSYTPVERFHTGAEVTVTGCPAMGCPDDTAELGAFPAKFLTAVRTEGAGRTNAGNYLNWSQNTGYWLDDTPRGNDGKPLRPWESAVADPGVVPRDTTFRIVECGRTSAGKAVDKAVCKKIRDVRWRVADQFAAGLGGPRHVGVYIGEETRADFTKTTWYVELAGATLAVG